MIGKLNELCKTMNFKSCAWTVFNRLVLEKGPGVLVLWGGHPDDKKKANKSYFLDMVEALEQGVSPAAADILPTELHELLSQLHAEQYQCVRIKEDCAPLIGGNVFGAPLSIAVPLAIAGAAHRRGLADGRNLVILCDDIQEFMQYNMRANEQYLRDLSGWLDRQRNVTFLGASRLTWDAKATLDSDPFKGQHTLALGWD